MTKKEKILLDNLWSKLVKLKADNKCEYCGKRSALNSHHVYSRSRMSTRFDEANGVCLCAGCHSLNNHSVHKAPIEFIEWLKEKRGKTWYTSLRLRANIPQKINFKLMKIYLENEIKKYEPRR